MDLQRFDGFANALGDRVTRRAAIRAAAAGTVGLAAVATHRAAVAQDATPEASPVASPAATDVGPALYIQTFTEGTWTPVTGDPGSYVLTLTGVAESTVVFPDGEPRAVTTIPTEDALEAIGFAPEDAPKAAVVVQTRAGELVTVVEVLDPFYDAAGGALIYTARVIEGEPGEALSEFFLRQVAEDFPESFGAGNVFIDTTE